MHTFDKQYWESHWRTVPPASTGRNVPEHPYLADEVADLEPGTALDAGCGEGAEAVWLATRGWTVTAADISAGALARAAERAAAKGVDPQTIQWIEADLGVWRPDTRFDLVSTFYAHPAIPQLTFYERIADWVAPGGTLLIVGHDHDAHQHGAHGDHQHGDHQHGDHRHGTRDEGGEHPPEAATATVSSITALLDDATWDVATARRHRRSVPRGPNGTVELHDVVVRAVRRS